MFTGIVQSIGTVSSVKRENGGIECAISVPLRRSWKRGESVLVDGVCSTIISVRDRTLSFQYMEETCDRSTACLYVRGIRVNIEPSLRVGDDLSGHILSGHVDGRGTIAMIEKSGMMTRIRVRVPKAIARYIVPKSSVAIDGVSLTVVSSSVRDFTVACIPHTLARTTLGLKKIGESVNIEVDIMAKYVERFFAKKFA